MDSPLGRNCMKAYGEIPFPNWVILQVLANINYYYKIAINTELAYMISREATNTYCMYTKTKSVGVWPAKIDNRDLVITNHYGVQPDGTIYIIGYT